MLKNTINNTPGPVFIGFAGKKQVGKDTAAKFASNILTELDISNEIISFAKPLKKICVDVLGLDPQRVYGNEQDRKTLTHIIWDNLPPYIRICYSNKPHELRSGQMNVREVMQVFGTDIIRNMLDDNTWIRLLFSKFQSDTNSPKVVLISDVRLPNEVKKINSLHGKNILLLRNTNLCDRHVSENALDRCNFDHIYDNNNTLLELHNFVQDLLVKESLI